MITFPAMAKSSAGRPALDGNAVRTQRTRERILAISLELFNGRGEAHVTTGMIAGELGMSPGNLYYHFHNKEEIVEAIFSGFEREIEEILSVPTNRQADVNDVWLFLHLLFETIWKYRLASAPSQ